MSKPRIDPITIAVTTRLKTTASNIADFEKTPYLMILYVRKGIQELYFINNKGQRQGGPYVEYYDVKGFKINHENDQNEPEGFSVLKVVLEQKVELVLTSNIDYSAYNKLKEYGIPVFKGEGDAHEAVFQLVKKELSEIQL